MINLTKNAKDESKKVNVTPTIVLMIEGYDKIFTSVAISTYIKIGDPGLEIGNDWVIGGVRLIDGQSTYMSFTSGGGTTTKISQKLSPDRAQGSSISSMIISLIDKNEDVSMLISPGFVLDDILGKNCEVYIGFKETSFPEDYNIVFRGLVSDVESGAGFVNLVLASSEEKKRRPLLNEATTELNGAMGAGALTTFDVIDGSIFKSEVVGPNLVVDPSFELLATIDDEIFRYTTVTGNTLSGVTRAYLGSVAATHDDLQDVGIGIRLQGNGLTLALKLMLSGWNDYFVSDIPVNIFNNISVIDQIDNAVFFYGINVEQLYGITVGDFITVSGATNGANNFVLRTVASIDITNDGSFVIVDGAALVSEFLSPAVASFRSKYDTLPIGLKMKPSEVDVARHEFIRDTFLQTHSYDFTLFKIDVAKEFIEKQLYLPMACFSIPRQGRSSVTYTIGPIAFNFIPTLDTDNVANAGALKPKRSISNNFSNVVQFSYDYSVADDKYKKVRPFTSVESQDRIQIGEKAFKVESQGMKTTLLAAQLSELAADRLLSRYRFGAEYVNGIKLLYGDGYPIEIGDIVLVNYASLKMTDLSLGTRDGSFKYMEVINKTLDNKTGEVSLDILNTSFEYGDRFGTISPSSKLDSGCLVNRLILKKSWGTVVYKDETEKWEDYINLKVVVHSPDWSFAEETTLKALGNSPDAMLIDPPLSIAPSEDFIVDAPYYPDDPDNGLNAEWKGLHAFFSPNVAVVSSASQTTFVVSPTDIDKFLVGAVVRINNFDYTDYSPEAKVVSVNLLIYEVEIDTASGFTIDSTHEIKLIGFKDAGASYRYI